MTSRGARHLNELAAQVARGDRAVQLFIVQRDDCSRLTIAADLDPVYHDTIRAARKSGVEVLAYGCSVATEEISVTTALHVEL